MGGKALNINTERKNTKEFLNISSNIQFLLEKELSIYTHLVKFYKNKESHGDIDILLKIDKKFQDKNINIKNFIENYLSPNDIITNGSVISFDYENIQVDLISVNEKDWETAKVYFDYDPSGNLMGKIAKSFGLKYGFKGLEYPLRTSSGRISENINISKNNKKIFEFLGYDYDSYSKGFSDLEDIFEYIINGKYFTPNKFKMENLTRIDKKRNKKRKTYQQFLNYVNNDLKRFENVIELDKNKDNYLEWIDKNFPDINLIQQINDFKQKDKRNQEISEKFNGKLVMKRHPNLKGRKLGVKISEFKNQFEDWNNFALNNSSEHILNKFDEFLNEK